MDEIDRAVLAKIAGDVLSTKTADAIATSPAPSAR
jgi:hypothetical protein